MELANSSQDNEAEAAHHAILDRRQVSLEDGEEDEQAHGHVRPDRAESNRPSEGRHQAHVEKEASLAQRQESVPTPVLSGTTGGQGSLLPRSGGTYIPPARLARMQQEALKTVSRASEAYQRISWEALKKSLNGLINKVDMCVLPLDLPLKRAFSLFLPSFPCAHFSICGCCCAR